MGRSWSSLRVALVAGGGFIAGLGMGRVLGATRGRGQPGGIVISDVGVYDRLSQLLFGPLFDKVATDAASAADGGRVLEVGSGPGHLATRLAAAHGLDVTGLDLDPQMVRRARARVAALSGPVPSFVVGDVGAIPFPDRSFTLVVSTLSMHHWDDPQRGLDEIARVLRDDGRALIWDLRPGVVPFHHHGGDPAVQAESSSLRLTACDPWRWPLRLTWLQRMEYVPRRLPPA